MAIPVAARMLATKKSGRALASKRGRRLAVKAPAASRYSKRIVI